MPLVTYKTRAMLKVLLIERRVFTINCIRHRNLNFSSIMLWSVLSLMNDLAKPRDRSQTLQYPTSLCELTSPVESV